MPLLPSIPKVGAYERGVGSSGGGGGGAAPSNVREFDGVDDTLLVTGGSVGALCNGAFSVVGIVKPTTTSGGPKAFLSIQDGATSVLSTLNNDSSATNLSSFSKSDDSSGNVFFTTGWGIIAMTKAAGTVAPKFHYKSLGSGSWTHTTGATTMASQAGSVLQFRFGAIGFAATPTFFKDCRIAAFAVYASALADLTVESVQTTPSTQKLIDLGAVGAWDFNQASTATAVADLVGTFNQTAITGTSVVTNDAPTGWTFKGPG